MGVAHAHSTHNMPMQSELPMAPCKQTAVDIWLYAFLVWARARAAYHKLPTVSNLVLPQAKQPEIYNPLCTGQDTAG